MNETLKKHLVVLLLYVVLTLVMTLPVALNLTTHIAGSGGDPWQTLWRFEEPLRFTELFGGGEPRLVNNSTIPWLPLHLLLGQPLAYNSIWLLSFVLSGYFMYLLVFHLIPTPSPYQGEGSRQAPLLAKERSAAGRVRWRRQWAPFLAGLLYMFLPFHVAHALGHFGAMQTQWLPLVIWLTLLFVERQTWWRAVGLAAAITMQSWTEHHYLLWYALFLVILWVVHLIPGPSPYQGEGSRQAPLLAKERSAAGRVRWRRQWMFLLALVSIFALLPWWPTVRQAFSGGAGLTLGFAQTIRFSADLFAFVIPASFHSIWGEPLATLLADDFTGNVAEATHYLGLVPLLLVIFFSQRTPKHQLRLWLIVAAVFGLIALGPRLHLLGTVTGLPLPYTLIDGLPVFSAIRAVGRASVMVGLAFAVLFGWVVAQHVQHRRLAIIVGAIVGLEFLFMPVALQSAQLSPVYQAVAALPGETLIELPAATNYTAASRALYASRQHGKTVIGTIALERGQVRDDFANGRSLPAVRQLLYLRSKHLQEGRPDFHGQDLVETFADLARYLDVRAVVVHRDSLSAVQLLAVTNFLEEQAGLTPQEFGDTVLYQLTNDFLGQGDGTFQLEDGEIITVSP